MAVELTALWCSLTLAVGQRARMGALPQLGEPTQALSGSSDLGSRSGKPFEVKGLCAIGAV